MTVYVDNAHIPFGNMIMCHMWADTIDELLAMADKIGVQRKWIQGHPQLSQGKARSASWVHFDIAMGKKELALRHGAWLMDQYAPLMHVAKLQGDKRKVKQIADLRRRRGYRLDGRLLAE